MKKLLSILMLLMFLGATLAADSGYALGKKGLDTDGAKEAGDRESKKSVLSGCDTLIEDGKFVEGTKFTLKEFKELRLAYGRKASGNEKWSISDDMLRRELNSMEMLGLITKGKEGQANLYRVAVSMSAPQMQRIDNRFGAEVASLMKSDSEREISEGKYESIGLNSYDLIEVTTQEEKQEMKRIVGQVILTTKDITADNDLKGVLYERVIALTEDAIINLSPEVLKDKIKDIGLNLRLAIATTRNIKTDKDGNFVNKEDELYVLRLLETLPIELDKAKDLVKERIIVFSYIPNSDMLAEIEAMTRATEGTLNNLSPATARALVDNI